MDSPLSSLLEEFRPEDIVQPHYRECYRLAIDALVARGREAYTELLKAERLGDFLSEDELLFIEESAERPAGGGQSEEPEASLPETSPSTGTYWPVHSDLDAPDLELGWPEVVYGQMKTNINLLFHPPRQNSPTIKEVIRKQIQDARQVIGIAMDIFTDVDIFKELVDASVRGVPVYVVLDSCQFKSFLAMAEKQEVHVQRLRNMRVRTVKGQEYLCRSGAKFHGVMGEKFLLVDCHTVVYGSYSFMWSYEKINLSMVQVITGQLVESYDEEFRMLYARSAVPDAFAPPDGVPPEITHDGSRALLGYGGKPFERMDQLRHTLDAVYVRTCGSQARLKSPMEGFDHELYERGSFNQRLTNDYMVPQRIHQLQSIDANSFLKRHSYAGERNDNPYVPNHLPYGASNWNVARDCNQLGVPPGRSDFLSRGMENPLQPSRLNPSYNRGTNIRQSFHGNDKQVLSMQQNMPSLERTAKTFLRNWRIQSYLSNEDQPISDSSDYHDHSEAVDNKPNLYLHSRLRSSLVFKSTIPEQPEASSYTSNSPASGFQGNQLAPPVSAGFHSSIPRIPAYGVGNRATPNDFLLKRRSLQILDDPRNNLYNGYNTSGYASLGRNKGGLPLKNPEVLHEERYKRFSLADPRSDTSYITNKDPSGHSTYGSGQAIAGDLNENTRTDRHPPSNLKEDQRSVSHYDVKRVADNKDPSAAIWQDPPSRTVSATALSVNSQDPPAKTSSPGSPRFFKKSSKKIISLLNIPEKREASHRAGNSSDIKTPEEAKRSGKKKGAFSNTASSDKSTDGGSPHKGNGGLLVSENHFTDDVGTSSAPRFSTEELEQTAALSDRRASPTACAGSNRPALAAEIHQREQKRARRPYSRFEPFCSFEKRQCEKLTISSAHLQGLERHESLPVHGTRGSFVTDHSSSSRAQLPGQHDNKFGRFIQRVGNFIHKNK